MFLHYQVLSYLNEHSVHLVGRIRRDDFTLVLERISKYLSENNVFDSSGILPYMASYVPKSSAWSTKKIEPSKLKKTPSAENFCRVVALKEGNGNINICTDYNHLGKPIKDWYSPEENLPRF